MALKEGIVSFFIENNVLVSPDFLENVTDEFNKDKFFGLFQRKLKEKPLVLNNDLFLVVSNIEQVFDLKWGEFERSRVLLEKGRDNALYNTFLDLMDYNLSEEKKQVIEELFKEHDEYKEDDEEKSDEANLIVLKSFVAPPYKKITVLDFINYFRNRYEVLKKILLNRVELQGTVSINKLNYKGEGDNVSLIGLVLNKEKTKGGNYILTLEDITSEYKVLVTKTKEEIFSLVKDIVLDEVIGITGTMGNKIIFCRGIFFPDVPFSNELIKAKEDVYVAFVGDPHFGSSLFKEKIFLNFIKWINGEHGNAEEVEIAKKVKYLFIVGDVVEGVGVYPGQEDDLLIKDIYKQYEYAASLLSKIKGDVKIIICGGNHDAMRLAEPQPIFDEKIAKPLHDLKNVYLVSNPSLINIYSSKDFPGFNVLIYHGGSFTYYSEVVESIYVAGGQSRSDLIMKFLLQKRHLAPAYGSTLYLPAFDIDPLVIEKVPDIFASGHIHRLATGNYRNINLINASCWVSQSEDQLKRGIIPDPYKVPLVNLRTREVMVLNFGEGNGK